MATSSDPIHGEIGVLLDDGEKVQCHVCGEWYLHLGSHAWHAHGRTDHHPLENAVAYKRQLDDLSSRIAQLVKVGGAIESSNMFTFDNSLAKGRKTTGDLSKLMLRAYSAEADNSIRSLRVGNVVTAKRRLEASRTAIAKLGKMMEMRIPDEFHSLRLEEIELTADWLMKKQEEKEAASEERVRLREERRVERELAEERTRLDKERAHILTALETLQDSGGQDPELEARLVTLDEAIVQNDYRIANIRAGYAYVISNRGAFGDNVVKTGLTRRLEPTDRVRELGGASVPFRFDVHALFFSEDAVTLETDLHHHFADLAVNQVNSRKEFFFATRPKSARFSQTRSETCSSSTSTPTQPSTCNQSGTGQTRPTTPDPTDRTRDNSAGSKFIVRAELAAPSDRRLNGIRAERVRLTMERNVLLNRLHRRAAGYGIREAAECLGIDRGHLSRIERGHRCPSPEVAGRIAELYRLPTAITDRLMAAAAHTRAYGRSIDVR